MLIDAIKRGGILWPLFVFFLGWIGALVYFFAVKRVHPAEYKPEYKPPIAPVRGGEQIEAEYGELEISNGTELDAFAVLIPGKRSVHVRSHDTVTLREDP
jgi:hypothetical protein